MIFNVCICSKSYRMSPTVLFCFSVLKGKNKLKKTPHKPQFVMQSIKWGIVGKGCSYTARSFHLVLADKQKRRSVLGPCYSSHWACSY